MEESSVQAVSSAPFSSSICMKFILMSSTAGAKVLLCSGETFRISMRPSATCSTASCIKKGSCLGIALRFE